jgi:hypothetical protein
MIHKGVQPDESVWLTRDGAAKGEDDVVKRALQWIGTLAYAHDVRVGKHFLNSDSLPLMAIVENPDSHSVVVSAIITNLQGALVDSVALLNDGLHGDGEAGDSLWGVFVKTPVDSGTYKICVRTDDKTSDFPSTQRRVGCCADYGGRLAGNLLMCFSLGEHPNPFKWISMVDQLLASDAWFVA